MGKKKRKKKPVKGILPFLMLLFFGLAFPSKSLAALDEVNIISSDTEEEIALTEEVIQDESDLSLSEEQELPSDSLMEYEGFVSPTPVISEDEGELRQSLLYASSDISPEMVLNGNYLYLTSEQILERLNAIRLEACENGYPYVENGTERPLTMEDYVPLKWSYDLEEIARQRAAEASVLTEHIRTDWSSCFSARSSSGMSASVESLAWNYSGIMYGINQWYAEKANYISQGGKTTKYEVGHYLAMINPNYQGVAIGGFRRSGDIFYTICQEFSRRAPSNENELGKTTGIVSVRVPVYAEDISRLTWKSGAANVNRGEVAEYVVNATTGSVFDNYFYGFTRISSRAYALSWTSSDPEILGVVGDGLVQGISAGRVLLTASSGGAAISKSITAYIKLEELLLNGELQEDSSRLISIVRGESASLFAGYSPADTTERDLTWKTSSSKICTVDNRGEITGLKGGSATITCTSKAGSEKIKVIVEPKLEEIRLSRSSISYLLGRTPKSLKLSVKYLPQDSYSEADKALEWTASVPAVADVDENGSITFGGVAGSSVITASAPGGISASCLVEINRSYTKPAIEVLDLTGNSPLVFTLKDSAEVQSAELVFEDGIEKEDISRIHWTTSSSALLLSASPGFDVSEYEEGSLSEISTVLSGVQKVYVKPRNPGLSASASITLTASLNNVKTQVKFKLTPAEGFMEDVYGNILLYDKKGRAAKGWRRSITGPSGEEGDYYFDSLCRMVKGEIKISGKWYSFDEQGKLITTDGLDTASGRYRNETGASLTGFQKIGDNWYYFDEAGQMQKGEVTVSGKSYLMDEEGHLLTGWNGEQYYRETGGAPSSGLGVMQTGLQTFTSGEEKILYYLTKEGMLKSTLRKTGGSWYFFGTDGRAGVLSLQALDEEADFANAGALHATQRKNGSLDKLYDSAEELYTGWASLGEEKLYVKSGTLQTGWVKLGSYRYYFDKENGSLETGGFKDGSTVWYSDEKGRAVSRAGISRRDGLLYYYDQESGLPVEGLRKVSGKWYLFHQNGAVQTGDVEDKTSGLTLRFDAGQLKQAVLTSSMNMGESGLTLASGLYSMENGDVLCFIRGIPASGWVGSGSGSRYFDQSTGDMQEGFITVSGKQYYLQEGTGLRHSEGWDGINGRIYYFDKNGVCLRGKKSLFCRNDDPEADLRRKYNYYFDPEDAHLLTKTFVTGNWWADEYGKLR